MYIHVLSLNWDTVLYNSKEKRESGLIIQKYIICTIQLKRNGTLLK